MQQRRRKDTEFARALKGFDEVWARVSGEKTVTAHSTGRQGKAAQPKPGNQSGKKPAQNRNPGNPRGGCPGRRR